MFIPRRDRRASHVLGSNRRHYLNRADLCVFILKYASVYGVPSSWKYYAHNDVDDLL